LFSRHDIPRRIRVAVFPSRANVRSTRDLAGSIVVEVRGTRWTMERTSGTFGENTRSIANGRASGEGDRAHGRRPEQETRPLRSPGNLLTFRFVLRGETDEAGSRRGKKQTFV